MLISAHLQTDRYGDFWLTDAVRPSLRNAVTPRQGYRTETYRHATDGIEVPVLAAAVSREQLFEVFLALLPPLGETVDVVLESSHRQQRGHRDFVREHIDLPVLQSYLYDFEELLLHDGCTGLAIVSHAGPIEVQLDEHKLLAIYAADIRPFERIMQAYGVRREQKLKLITEGEHLHHTTPKHRTQFTQLSNRLGVSESVERVRW